MELRQAGRRTAMKKLDLKLIDYLLMAGLIAVTAGTVVPGFADSMTPIISQGGSIMFDAFFFIFCNA
jgi:hypothetical protein